MRNIEKTTWVGASDSHMLLMVITTAKSIQEEHQSTAQEEHNQRTQQSYPSTRYGDQREGCEQY